MAFFRTIIESPSPRNVATPSRMAVPTRIATPTRTPADPVLPNPVFQVSAVTGNSGASTSTSAGFGNVISSGSNRFIIVAVAYFDTVGGARTISSVDLSGTPMTQRYYYLTDSLGPFNNYILAMEIWYLIAPPVTNLGVVNITWTGAVYWAAIAKSFTGVHQTVPFGAEYSQDISGSTKFEGRVGGTKQIGTIVFSAIGEQNTSGSSGSFTGGEFKKDYVTNIAPTRIVSLNVGLEEGYSGITPIQFGAMAGGAAQSYCVELQRTY